MKDDLCFRCSLPDCDDGNPRCVVRQTQRRYYAKVRKGQHDQITEEEREANNLIFETWHLDRIAEASEGGRPYRRGSTIYGRGMSS